MEQLSAVTPSVDAEVVLIVMQAARFVGPDGNTIQQAMDAATKSFDEWADNWMLAMLFAWDTKQGNAGCKKNKTMTDTKNAMVETKNKQ